jgi:hypothetical protein
MKLIQVNWSSLVGGPATYHLLLWRSVVERTFGWIFENIEHMFATRKTGSASLTVRVTSTRFDLGKLSYCRF